MENAFLADAAIRKDPTQSARRDFETDASGQLTNADLSRRTGKRADARSEYDHNQNRVRCHEEKLRACGADLAGISD